MEKTKRNRQPRRTATYKVKKCPKCKQETLQVKTTNRINKTHGKYGKTIKTPITEKAICNNITQKDGKETPCGYAHRRELRRRKT